MEFKLNEDQQMIHDLAKDFAESVLQPRIDEIEAGEMTGDLARITTLPNPTTLSTGEFIQAIAKRLAA